MNYMHVDLNKCYSSVFLGSGQLLCCLWERRGMFNKVCAFLFCRSGNGEYWWDLCGIDLWINHCCVCGSDGVCVVHTALCWNRWGMISFLTHNRRLPQPVTAAFMVLCVRYLPMCGTIGMLDSVQYWKPLKNLLDQSFGILQADCKVIQ